MNANNRASRFEAVHGASISQGLSELKSITRHISTSRLALTTLDGAKDLAKTELNSKISLAENILVSELSSLKDSKISADPELWRLACDNQLWDKVRAGYSDILVATSIDAVPKALDALTRHINEIVEKLQTAREYENTIPG